MQHFIKHFQRYGAGRWLCVEPATLELPQGRVQVVPGTIFIRGTSFMNVDLAEMLEAQYTKDQQQR